MSIRDNNIYVGHMLDIAHKIQSIIKNKDRKLYDSDEVLRLALTHLIQTIGEADRNITQEFRDEYPSVPWKTIVGMRHKVVHDYLYVDEDLVWKTAIEDIPNLIIALEKIVPPEG